VAAEREQRVVAKLDCAEAPVFELARCRPRRSLALEIRQRSAAPERERGIEVVGRGRRAVLVERRAGPGDELLEAVEVELPGLDMQPVRAAGGLDSLLAECAPQPVDVNLERPRGLCGRLGAPDGVDQLLARDGAVGVEEQLGQDRALLGPAECQSVRAVDRLERPEDAQLHRLPKIPTCAPPSQRSARVPARARPPGSPAGVP
jgi:hypothetical protein